MSAATAERQKHPIAVIREQFEARAMDLKNALPAHIPPERFIRIVLTALQLNPDLVACDRQSLWNSALKCASDGLIPDGREGALVPFGNNVQYLPMVGGLLKRFRNSGQFKSISCGVVREGEEFSYWIDEHGEHMRHVPGDGTGKSIKAYALAETRDGGVMIKVMTEAEINKRRNMSRAKNSPLWSTWQDEAWQKTVLRNLAKRLPTSSDLDELITHSDEEFDLSVKPEAPVERIKDVSAALDRFGGEPKVTDADVEEEPELITEEMADQARITPDMSPIEQAFALGVQARKSGMSRRAVPPEYRGKEQLELAMRWTAGWDSVKEE